MKEEEVFKAAESGDIRVFQSLSSDKLSRVLSLRNEDGRSLLHVASSFSHPLVPSDFIFSDSASKETMDSPLLAETLCCSSKSDDKIDNYPNIHIPDVLIYDILSRLPSKSLVRFRCVCKSWYSLVTHDLEFHKLHLLNSTSNNEGPCWIAFQHGKRDGPHNARFLLYDESFVSPKIQPYVIQKEETAPIVVSWARIIDSCNGVVCLYLPVDGRPKEKFLICLWNPSIRKYKRVTFPLNFPWEAYSIREFSDNFLLGFGWSRSSNEYKAVVICREKDTKVSVYVYSLITNSWIEIRANLDEWNTVLTKDEGAYFNGACHWIRFHKTPEDYTMLIFNLNDHSFRYIDLPPQSKLLLPSDCFDSFKTTIFKEMLSVWEIITLGHTYTVNIWVLKEYEDCSSWSFFKRVPIKDTCDHMFRSCSLFGIDARGRLLFSVLNYNHTTPLKACDSESGEIEELQSCDSDTEDVWEMAPYQESLALL